MLRTSDLHPSGDRITPPAPRCMAIRYLAAALVDTTCLESQTSDSFFHRFPFLYVRHNIVCSSQPSLLAISCNLTSTKTDHPHCDLSLAKQPTRQSVELHLYVWGPWSVLQGPGCRECSSCSKYVSDSPNYGLPPRLFSTVRSLEPLSPQKPAPPGQMYSLQLLSLSRRIHSSAHPSSRSGFLATTFAAPGTQPPKSQCILCNRTRPLEVQPTTQVTMYSM